MLSSSCILRSLCAEQDSSISNCVTLKSIKDSLDNAEEIGALLVNGSCSVNHDCDQIHCGLLDNREFSITIMDCTDPPGIGVTVTDENDETVFSETFSDGERVSTFEDMTFKVRILQKDNNILGMEVCFANSYTAKYVL